MREKFRQSSAEEKVGCIDRILEPVGKFSIYYGYGYLLKEVSRRIIPFRNIQEKCEGAIGNDFCKLVSHDSALMQYKRFA